MDPLIQNALIPFAAALGGGAGSEIIKPVARIFDNWFFQTYGLKSELKRGKAEKDLKSTLEEYQPRNLDASVLNPMFDEENLLAFKNEILDELLILVKNDQLIIPNKTDLGLLFDSSKFFLDEEELRKAYAKLIVATADSAKENLVHRSFAEVLKNISANELDLIKDLYKEKKRAPFDLAVIEDCGYYIVECDLGNMEDSNLPSSSGVPGEVTHFEIGDFYPASPMYRCTDFYSIFGPTIKPYVTGDSTSLSILIQSGIIEEKFTELAPSYQMKFNGNDNGSVGLKRTSYPHIRKIKKNNPLIKKIFEDNKDQLFDNLLSFSRYKEENVELLITDEDLSEYKKSLEPEQREFFLIKDYIYVFEFYILLKVYGFTKYGEQLVNVLGDLQTGE